MLTGMLNFYFSCVRGNVPVPNIAAETAAMLDDVSHQAEFSSKQVSCHISINLSDFGFLFPAVRGTALSCRDFRNHEYKFVFRTGKGCLASSPVFYFGKNIQP